MAALSYKFNFHTQPCQHTSKKFSTYTPPLFSIKSQSQFSYNKRSILTANTKRTTNLSPIQHKNVKSSTPTSANTSQPVYSSSHRADFEASDHLKPWFPKFAAINSLFKTHFLNISSRIFALPLSRTYTFLKPFVGRQWITILKAWLCTLVAVGCLYLAIPRIGELSALLGAGDFTLLRKKVLVTMALVVSRSIAQYFQQALLWEAALNVAYEIRSHVFERVLKRDMSFFEGAGGALAGDIAYRITGEAKDAADTVYALLHTLVPSMLQLTAMAVHMFFLSPILSLATISVIPFMSLAIAYLGSKLRHISRKGQDSIARISSYLNEVLPSMVIIKAYNAENSEHSRFQKLAEADRNAHISKKKLKAFIPEVIGIVYAGTTLVLLLVGSWLISCGAFNGTGMVSFVTSLVLLNEPIQDIGKAYNELKQGEPAIERLFELTTFCRQVVDKDDAAALNSIAGDVKFRNVSFQYGDTLPQVLSNLSLHVRAGETVALVGPSGGGKTTLAKLLLRLYDPIDAGCILVDDRDIRNICLKSLRQCIALVPQDCALFAGSVAENIGYGNMPNTIDMRKVEQAAKLANADEFIQKLPKGYDTNVGQRGSCLSGGQRQRLAIARAIYQESSILILDEATSALDNKSELLVRDALEHLMANCTVFIIAHRLETVRKADRIFLLDGGKLVEEGSHSSLLAQGGHYASLYSRQELFRHV